MTEKMNDNSTKHNGRSHWNRFRDFLREYFNLDADKASEEEVRDNIRKGVEFRGTNLWVLIFAIFIASIGLNVNSTAVIIGAMLVSPLMGPIMGVGLALGVSNFDLMKQSLRSLALAAGVGLATSTLYFWVSPLSTAQSELLARTTPTIYDVLIALFGGWRGSSPSRERTARRPSSRVSRSLRPSCLRSVRPVSGWREAIGRSSAGRSTSSSSMPSSSLWGLSLLSGS